MGFKANELIMNFTIRGAYGDTPGWITLNWKTVGQYMVVLIENMDANERYYRVFHFPKKPYYEYKQIVRPSYTAEDYLCIYDSVENAKGRVVLHSAEEQWMDYVRGELGALARD